MANQAAHTITLTTAQSSLKFLSMEGSEEISRLFEYTLLAVAPNDQTVVLHDLLGKPAHVKVALSGVAQRHYHAIVSAASYEGDVGKHYQAWRLTLRPWLWLATRTNSLRIFQKLSVPDILRKVLHPYGGDISLQLQATYRKRDYCVQYRESDFNFASRLMEDEGIFYFFRHEAGKHTLVLGDQASVHANQFGLSKMSFQDRTVPDSCVTRWRWSEQIQTGKVQLREFSLQRPNAIYDKTAASVSRAHAWTDLQAYDYPAGIPPYEDTPAATAKLDDETLSIAKRRIEEQQSGYERVDGDAECVRLASGALFTLDKHKSRNGDYVVASTKLHMRLSGYEAGATLESEHRCSFTAFPAKLAFRPARLTRKPAVGGPQTATVVGPSGDEIHVDKYGRVKLQFHWDRDGKKDQDSSCYVRVAQPSAGKGWGMVFLPRVGHEVVVDFLEGDPDQPIVTGRMYNAENMPPYQLPDKKTVSTIKSRSTKGGGAADFNELRFEDLKGSEYLLLHAQKDKLEFVEATERVLVGADQHHTIKKDRKEKIEGEHHLTVVKDVKHKFDGKYNLTVAKDILLDTAAKHSLKAAQDITAETGTAYSIKAGTDLHIKAGKNVGVDGGMNLHIKGGMNVVIEGGMQLTLKAAGGSVVIGPDGVSITGPMVKINSGGAAGSGAGASPVAPTAPDAPSDPEAPEDPLSHS